jgi:phage integrase family site-specific recombinase
MSKKYKCVSRNKKGKIYYEVEFSVDPSTGDRKRFRVKSYKDQFGIDFKTEKQAFDEVCRIRTEYNAKIASASTKRPQLDIPFSKFMEDVYLPYYKKTVQPVTYQTAFPQYKTFIEVFADKKLSEINVRECEDFRLSLMEDYSPNYAKGLWCKLKKCLNYAERLEYIENNPCRKLDNPKGEKSKTEFWTVEELDKVLKTFDQTVYEERQFYTAIWLYFMTGMRVSEGLSLKWSDIDLKNKVIHIQSTLEYQGNGKYVRKEQTKTRAGMRFLEIDDETVKVLQNWRTVQVYNREDNFVLARFNSPMNKSTLSRMLKRHALVAKVPVITGKGLRHSHDSFMINVLKKDVLYVSARSGRTDKATTLNTYSHFYDRQVVSGGAEITEVLGELGLTANPATIPPSKETK